MRLVFLLLSGCACPAFEDIEVTTTATDAAELAPTEATGLVEDALATFAAWTAREGVCVDEVTVADRVSVMRGAAWYSVGGVYRPAARRIELKAAPGIEESALHELCHALDADERLTAQHRDLLDTTIVPDSDLYVTEDERLVEAFAYTCQEGPVGLGVAGAVAEACGDDLVGERARFFRDVVFPGFAQAGDVEVGTPLDAPTWHTGLGLATTAHVEVFEMGADDAGFLVLTREYRETAEPPEVRLRRYDADTQASLGSVALPLPADMETWEADAALVPTDTGRAWVAVREGDTVLVDPDAGVALDLDGTSWPPAAAIVGGVYYGATPDGLFAADVATGARVDLPDEGLPAGAIDEVFLAGADVGVRVGDTVARLVNGRWEAAPPLDGVSGPPVVRDGALSFRADTGDGWQPVRLDAAWATWTVDPWCDGPADAHAGLLTVAGRPVVAARNYPYVELLVSELP